eukprot:797273-Pyramimonas_sp.AAC.1
MPFNAWQEFRDTLSQSDDVESRADGVPSGLALPVDTAGPEIDSAGDAEDTGAVLTAGFRVLLKKPIAIRPGADKRDLAMDRLRGS